MSRIALVVGINSYNHIPKLKAPSQDAEAVAQRLARDGDFRVIRLPEVIENAKPVLSSNTFVTRAELKRALVQLFKPDSQQSPDTALFYFSGHGVRDTLGFSEGYLATSDVNPRQDSFGLSLRWLRRLLEESPVKQQVIWLDCCHSGELLNFGEADPGERGKGRDRCFIAASRDFEAAYEDLTSPNSVLTSALLKGLDPQRYSNRWVDNFLLADFINQALRAEIQSPVCNNSGEPINLTRCWSDEKALVSQVSAESACPYKGLAFFDCNDDDPKYFYGRTALTDQLLDTVRQSNFLAIVGASGSGKSSVLRAGLLHQLKLGRRVSGSDQWDIRIVVPGAHPLQKLAAAFVDEGGTQLSRAEGIRQAETLISQGADGLRCLVQASSAPRVVLVLDQFEECFTLCEDTEERQQFFACVLEALNLCPEKLCVVLAMRADFFGKCVEQDYSGLAKYVEGNLVAVKAMSQDELADAITKPSESVGLTVEPELVQEMLADIVGAPASLPLMQYALRELWQQRQGNQLQLKVYSRLGGAMGTLKKRATSIYYDFDKLQQHATRHIFLSLTQLGEGTEDTRRRVIKQDLITPAYSENLIDKTVQELADANLVVTSEVVGKSDDSQRLAVVDVAHEALIRHWPLLRTWLDANREIIRRQRKIEVMADEWQDQKKKIDYLLRGAQLADATDFLKKHSQKLPISKNALYYIERSLKRRRTIRIRYSSILIIPLIIFEILFRNTSVQNHQDKLRDRAPYNNKSSIVALTRGCRESSDETFYLLNNFRNSFAFAKRYFQTRLFGNCTQIYEGQFAKSDFSNLSLKYTNFSRPNFSFSTLIQTDLSNSYAYSSNFIFSNLESANLRKSSLSGAYFRNADLENADLSFANLDGSDFRDANVSGTNFKKAYLGNVDFRNTNLNDADLSGAVYTATTQFPENFVTDRSSLYFIAPGITLSNGDLEEVSLTSGNLLGSRLNGMNLSKAQLGRINLSTSTLNKVFFKEASLSGANLSDSKIVFSSFEEAFLSSADFENAYLKESSFVSAKLLGANFRDASLTNIDLSKANLSKSDLRGADLEDSTVVETSFKGALYSYKTKFPNGFSPEEHNMLLIDEGSNLSKAKLGGVNLLSANLQNANLRKADLRRANLRNANLAGSDLTKAKLGSAVYNGDTVFPKDFDPAQHEMYFITPKANLSSANLVSVDLNSENLEQAILTNSNLSASFLQDANLEKADLRVVSFVQADLTYANLQNTKLAFASFRNADLSHANLSGSNLENADFPSAILVGTNLLNTTDLATDMLETAKLCQTKLPQEINLDPNRDCAELGISQEE